LRPPNEVAGPGEGEEMTEISKARCSECGHLHRTVDGYTACPIEGCECPFARGVADRDLPDVDLSAPTEVRGTHRWVAADGVRYGDMIGRHVITAATRREDGRVAVTFDDGKVIHEETADWMFRVFRPACEWEVQVDGPRYPEIEVQLTGRDGTLSRCWVRCRRRCVITPSMTGLSASSWTRRSPLTTTTCCRPRCGGSQFSDRGSP
jgi:hypothetical protein